ncbi:MAG: peptidoglycan-binding protein [Bacilli bacterium]|nr:peptidoglycan-binding protein [Bacilli bacterium]
MNFEQLKPFYPKDMGTAKGWCLLNVAKGFHATPSANPSASAKADMNSNIARGTFHSKLNDIPTNCAVPVYVKSTSQYGHVVAYDKGVYYTDGRRYTPVTADIIGWGEWCNGFQIVKKGTTKSFLPAKGWWGRYDKDDRVAILARFMRLKFPAYTSAKALGPVYGDYLWKSIKEFQKRTGLAPDGNTGPITYAKLKEYGFVY